MRKSIRKAAGENEGGVTEKPQESLTFVCMFMCMCAFECAVT